VTTTDPAEALLWQRARAGDADAFGAIFDLHQSRVYRQARRLTDSVHDAEDVTALVFLEAWRKRESVRVVDGSVIAWLAVTAGNVARNASRSRNRHRALIAKLHESPSGLVSSASAPDPADEVGERIDRASLGATARAALARLPKRDQDVIALCIIQGLTAVQAAAALGVAPGTVKSRLSRARQRLSADVLATLNPLDPSTYSTPSTDADTQGGAR
jgi:RNA polymerase sigma-70 factor (ECF subfamily)